MSKREIASLACKILGICLFVKGIVSLLSFITYSVSGSYKIQPAGIVIVLASIIFGIIIYFLSDNISTFMIKDETDDSKGGTAIQAGEIHNIAFSVLGLYFLGSSLPKLVSLITEVITRLYIGYSVGLTLLNGLNIIAEIIIGLIIFLGSKRLVNLLRNI